jgi:2-methylcitrate dehydratase PrpD
MPHVTAAGATISEQLARYVNGTAFEDLPPEVVEKTKQCILDAVGCMVAGSQDRVGATITSHAVRHGLPGHCSVFGREERLSPAYATLANGTSAHVLDLDDGHRPSGTHLGSAVVPAAVAMAEATGASGPDLLVSVTLGYDVMGRVGEAVCLPRPSAAHMFHAGGTVGVFGSVAAAGKLLGLNVDQLVNALGIAGDGASGLREFRPTGADCKALHVGRAGQTGITAAYLAAEGFQGSATIIEGPKGFCAAMTHEPRPELICAELGTRFAVIESGFKLYPCVQMLHLPIEAALSLRREYDLEPQSIQRIKLALPEWARSEYANRQRPPLTVGNARFSMSFAIAAALQDGEVARRQFTQKKLVDHGIARLERLVEYASDPEVEAIFSEQEMDEPYFFIPCALEIYGHGRRYRRVVRTPFGGDPKLGLTRAQVIAKFRSVGDGILSASSADRVAEWVLDLDQHETVKTFPDLFQYELVPA